MAGIIFPKAADGERSTTAFNKVVFAACAEAAGDAELAEAIKKERDWRHKYPKHLTGLLEAQVRAGRAKCVDSLRAALAAARAMDFEPASGSEAVPLEAAMMAPSESFDVARIAGSGSAAGAFEVPFDYRSGNPLSGEALGEQLSKWVEYGCMEQDCATAVQAGISKLESLKGRTFIIIGAGSELGPLRHLLRAGATVAAIATRKAQRWQALIDFARNTPGTLLLPVATGTDLSAGDAAIAGAAGADLLRESPQVARWVSRVVSEAPGQVTVGTYLYTDGGPNVSVTVAADYIVSETAKWGPAKVSFAWLGSPATAHLVTPEAAAGQQANMANESWWHKTIFSAQLAKGVMAEDGRQLFVLNGYSVLQGPNYALAQHIRQWRAMLLHSENFVVSTPMTPVCRTESVCHNGTMKACLDGMAYMKPLEAFHPETASALMMAVLVSDLTEPVPQLASPLEIVTRKSFHSGLWRFPFEFESCGKFMFVMGKISPYDTPQ